MSRGRGQLEAGNGRQGLDGPLGLAEQLEQLDALGVDDDLANPGQLLKHDVSPGAFPWIFHRYMDNRMWPFLQPGNPRPRQARAGGREDEDHGSTRGRPRVERARLPGATPLRGPPCFGVGG